MQPEKEQISTDTNPQEDDEELEGDFIDRDDLEDEEEQKQNQPQSQQPQQDDEQSMEFDQASEEQMANPSDPYIYSNSSSSKGENKEVVDPYNSSFGMTLGKSIQEKPVKQDSPSKSLPKNTTPEIFGDLKKEQKEENNRFQEFDDLDEDEERDDLERESDGDVIASS